jgi:hypothetical protein
MGAKTGAAEKPRIAVLVLLPHDCAAVRYEVLAMICCKLQLPAAAHCVYFHGIQRQFSAQ